MGQNIGALALQYSRRTALGRMHEQVAVPTMSDGLEVAFASFRLKADGTLLRGDTTVHLPPKELAALKLMAANAGRIVTPQELRVALWGDVHVTEDSVPRCVSSLRARLQPEECIQTVYKRGYRFTVEVRVLRDGRPSQPLPRIAILPFASGNGVPDYLGTAVAEETMMRVSRIRPAAISVLAQDSVFTLARRELTAQQIGAMLNADMVLAGSLNALSMHYRLRAEMIRVRDGVQVWVEDVLVDRGRIAGLETELARRLGFRLGAVLAAGDLLPPAMASDRGMDDVRATQSEGLSISAAAEPAGGLREAYEVFQRAHHEWQSLQRHRMQDGLQHLLCATELYPSLLGARMDLVNLCVTQCFYGFMSPAMESEIARRATEPIGDLLTRAEAVLPSLAWISFHVDRNLPEALRLFAASAHLPHSSWITRTRSMFALSRHRFDEAVDLLRGAIRQDPYAPWLHARLAWALHLAGEARESLDQIRHALDQFPDHEGVSLYGSIILACNGDAGQAVKLTTELAQRLPHFDPGISVHACALASAGRKDEARATLERLEWLGRERYLMRAFLPAVYIALGEEDSAIAELSASEESCCPWFFQMLADPRLKALHGHPEFERMQSSLAAMEANAALQAQFAD